MTRRRRWHLRQDRRRAPPQASRRIVVPVLELLRRRRRRQVEREVDGRFGRGDAAGVGSAPAMRIDYTKTTRLMPGVPQMVIEHRLRNTGRSRSSRAPTITTSSSWTGSRPVPAFVVTAPFSLTTTGRPTRPWPSCVATSSCTTRCWRWATRCRRGCRDSGPALPTTTSGSRTRTSGLESDSWRSASDEPGALVDSDDARARAVHRLGDQAWRGVRVDLHL